MIFWILVAVMTAAAAAALLHPLLRRATGRADLYAESQTEVYRDQLRELERDLTNKLISPAEAENARAEIGRRLLSAARDVHREVRLGVGGHRFIQMFIIILLPLVSLCLYLDSGRPDLPAQPLAARLQNSGEDMAILLLQMERHLVSNPEDGKGWDLLAPIYLNSGRVDDAQKAYRNAIRLLEPTPSRLDGLAEALMAGADGMVTPEVRQILAQSLVLEPNNPRARFYLALGLEQDGKAVDARAAFEALQKDSPANAPWQALVAEHIAKNGGKDENQSTPVPSASDIAAADTMTPAARQDMIRGMVDRLDAKLRKNPSDFDGWMKLIRSYSVLNDKQAARDALKRAIAAFPANGNEGKQLLALAESLGVDMRGIAE
ncbi:c-type cytochrome biogenesis protein CcmI [Oryzifoliimicrobium ureilyticus]|uniref:c-type cytochrome biogenesis protein CcmI n=1 Tax=Oryzifoliimicrobium ureilyticus TaxID=3113724 RepID=UPI00307668D6